MKSQAPDPRVSQRPGEMVADRYLLEHSLGKGGMGSVYAARDQRTGRLVALKRLHPQADLTKAARSLELFEREYYTLAQLAHPHIVEAYDYGLHQNAPYYTMELLDGGGLEQLAPLPWREVCALGRAIAAALALIHARRLVFRDLNPRNVRRTREGVAKLIDFGALCSMGQSQQLIGTPAYCAPETLDMQPLDARTDLYSLGATLYFALTGRHAYPARSFEQLQRYWGADPCSPRALVPEIPLPLDALVMHLMHADPAMRPSSAAEVAPQLLVIEGKTTEETAQLSTSYLTTPTLVGREPVLARVRRRLQRAQSGRGSALLIAGPAGGGRSRLLAACLLEAKLQGALALRADASDDREYSVARSLCEQLLLLARQPTLRAATAEPVLSYILPELWEGQAVAPPVPPALAPGELRAQVFEALRRWLFAIAREQPLLIAVDDLHRVDEPSAAALALLLRDVASERVLIVGSAPMGVLRDPPAALRLFAQTATEQLLAPLNQQETEALLRSVFGDVPHLTAVAQALFAISAGNPRDLMDLAEALVAKRLAQYDAGVWSLPARIGEGALPSNMLQELHERVAQLSPLAREVLSYMALAADRALTFEEHAALCTPSTPVEVGAALLELTRAQLASVTGSTYALQRRGPQSLLLEELMAERKRAMHARLAQVFARRGGDEVRRAMHLMAAGDAQPGLSVLLVEAARSQALTDADPQEFLKLTTSLPAEWFECYLSGLELCTDHERPKLSRYTLAYRLAGLMDVMDVPGDLGMKPLTTLLQQLSEDSGLADWAALDPGMETMERLKQAIGAAQARFEACPEPARGYDPITAIRVLVRSTLAIVACAARNLDWRLLESLPSLEPLVVLSPAVAAVHRLAQGVTARTTARFELAREVYLELVERTAQPGATGLDESHQRYLRYGVMFGLGTIEATLGLPSALHWASEIEGEPLHRINAQLIRLLHALWQGQVDEAERLQREIEAMRLQGGARQWLDGASLVGEAVVNALSDDLTRVKRTCESIEPLARKQRPWAAVLEYAQAEHQRIRGDLRGAQQALERLVASLAAGQHQIWPNACGAHVRVLGELGELAQACEHGQTYLKHAEGAGLGQMASFIKLPLALALAQRGQLSAARQLVNEVLAGLGARGASGLNLVLAHEAAARIALMDNDFARFRAHCEVCERSAETHAARALRARCEKLKRLGHAQLARARASAHEQNVLGDSLDTAMQGELSLHERAEGILHWLVRGTAARGGVLYLQQTRGLTLCAQTPDVQTSSTLEQEVERFLFSQAQQADSDDTQSLSEEDAHELGPKLLHVDERGDRYRALLLGHSTDDGFMVSGVAVLVEPSSGKLAITADVITRASRAAAMSDGAELTLVS